MRLIDADAFSEEMKRRQDACEKWMHDAERLNDEDMISRANGAWSVFIETKLTLDKQPTVEPDMAQVLAYECGKAERKRGRWIKQMDELAWWYECSVCGDYPLKDAYGYESLSQFCPNCGADMRGEANEREQIQMDT